jgi:predicted SnoaL-like aldol condensation-catalyzing enzyme
MSQETEEVLLRWFREVWNQGRADTIDALFPDDGIAHGVGEPGVIARGPKEFKVFQAQVKAAFPVIKLTIVDIISVDQTVAARWVGLLTPAGSPAGQPLNITGMTFARIAGGKIVEAWNNWDYPKVVQAVQEMMALKASARP